MLRRTLVSAALASSLLAADVVLLTLFLNPETRAYGADGRPETRLYLVQFDQRDVWADYDGPENDRLLADVYEHWLESAE